jgi:hypothetical protein
MIKCFRCDVELKELAVNYKVEETQVVIDLILEPNFTSDLKLGCVNMVECMKRKQK